MKSFAVRYIFIIESFQIPLKVHTPIPLISRVRFLFDNFSLLIKINTSDRIMRKEQTILLNMRIKLFVHATEMPD